MTWVQIIRRSTPLWDPRSSFPLLCHVSSSAGKSGWAELTPNGRWLQVAHKFVFISTKQKKKHISARIVVYFLMSSLSLLSYFPFTHDINCTAIDRSRIPLCCAQVLVLFLAFPLHLYLACLFRNEKWNWVLRVARHQLPSSICDFFNFNFIFSCFYRGFFSPFPHRVSNTVSDAVARGPLSEYT